MEKTLRTLLLGMMAMFIGNALTSCSTDDDPQVNPEGQKGYVEFSLSRGVDTRTAYTFNEDTKGLDVTWKEGDQIYVFFNYLAESNDDVICETFNLIEGAGTKTAKFAKSDSQLANKSGEVQLCPFKIFRRDFFVFSEQEGTIDNLADYDFFSFPAKLKDGQITSIDTSSGRPMAIYRFKANDIIFVEGGGTKEFVFSGGINKFEAEEAVKGDIIIKNVSLNSEGKLNKDLYVFVHYRSVPTKLKVGEKEFTLSTGNIDSGKIYTFSQSNLKES